MYIVAIRNEASFWWNGTIKNPNTATVSRAFYYNNNSNNDISICTRCSTYLYIWNIQNFKTKESTGYMKKPLTVNKSYTFNIHRIHYGAQTTKSRLDRLLLILSFAGLRLSKAAPGI